MTKTKKIILKIFLGIVAIAGVVLIGAVGYIFYQMYDYFKEHIYMNPQERQEYIHRFDADRYFTDQKVVEFCNAIKDNDFQKTDELLKQGVDVNYQGEGGITPALWLLRKTDEGEQKKKGLKYLLEKGANPIILYHTKTRGDQTVLHTVAQHRDSDYLKMVLESGNLKKEDVDFELPNTAQPTAILLSVYSERFKNLKMLLDFEANKNYIVQADPDEPNLTNETALLNLWKYTYELLTRGSDYDYALNHGLRRAIEKGYDATWQIESRGVDYHLKSWQFLKDKGINLKLNLWPNQKYVVENGKYVLYVNESTTSDGKKIEGKEDKWIKYKDSSLYKNLSEENKKKIKQPPPVVRPLGEEK